MHADIGRAGAAGPHGVEQFQFSVGPTDGKRADGALLVVASPIGFVGGIKAGTRGIERQATRARAHLDDAHGRHRAGGAIDLEEMDAAAVAGRQIHLGRQRVAKRSAEGPDIGDKRPGGLARSRPWWETRQRGKPDQGGCCLQERAT